eukprot:m.138440 g.138440  ORF g.138440 m.138440 type:complete len:317 (+) comp20267_c0_seq2:728-1678(+)
MFHRNFMGEAARVHDDWVWGCLFDVQGGPLFSQRKGGNRKMALERMKRNFFLVSRSLLLALHLSSLSSLLSLSLARSLALVYSGKARGLAVLSFVSQHSTACARVTSDEGYVGYEEGGTLTEAVRRRPYSVVLLDEFEKAHREVANLLLQVLDDGHLTDSQGHRVDFRNTIIIMTSNLGSQAVAQVGGMNTRVQAEAMQALKAHFSPEFVNRIDEIVTFNNLSRENMGGILEIRLQELRKRLADKNVQLELADDVKMWLCNEGYDPVYGARPMNRIIQRHVMNPVARALLNGTVREGEIVRLRLGADGHPELQTQQ